MDCKSILLQSKLSNYSTNSNFKMFVYFFLYLFRKRTITSTELFDFCSDIVANVPDPITEEDGGAGGAGGEPKKKRQRKKPTAPKMNDSDIEGENPPPKKRQATKAKVVKDEAEEDDGESDEPKASGSGNVGNVKDESDDYSDGGEE